MSMETLLQSNEDKFDELPCITGSEKDLDWEVIKQFFATANRKITTQSAHNIGILTNHFTKEVPSFGGILLFGKDRLKMFPEAIIRCVRFAGENRDIIIDRADIETYLPLAIEEAIKFIKRNTKLGSEITELRRKDIPEYPPKAVREVVTNAVVHADYSITGIYISVAIFNDRMEITNPGRLPYGITIEKILSGASRVRNRVIAKAFYHAKIIEQWGRGVSSIINECKKHELKEPKFEELNNQFRVTLYSKKETANIAQNDEWDELAITHLSKNKKKLSTKEAAEIWNVTPRTARSRLIKMINSGIIKKIGTSPKDPKGYYILNKKS